MASPKTIWDTLRPVARGAEGGRSSSSG